MELLSDIPEILTVPEAAKSLKVGRTTMYRLIQSGAVRHIKLGKKIRIPRAYLNDFIEHSASQ